MAERDKEWMDGEVQGALKGYKVNWQTRQGAPYSAAGNGSLLQLPYGL